MNPTSIRLKPSIHKDLKETCDANNLNISKVLEKLIVLFLSDNQLQARVLREVRIK